MKGRLFLLILMILSLAGLAGCSGGSPTSQAAAPAPIEYGSDTVAPPVAAPVVTTPVTAPVTTPVVTVPVVTTPVTTAPPVVTTPVVTAPIVTVPVVTPPVTPVQPAPAITSWTATLTWTPPTQNTDGSALTDLAGFKVYDGGTSIATVGASVQTYFLEAIAEGEHNYSLTAFNAAGTESAASNVVRKVFSQTSVTDSLRDAGQWQPTRMVAGLAFEAHFKRHTYKSVVTEVADRVRSRRLTSLASSQEKSS
jgi:hypothetical protein